MTTEMDWVSQVRQGDALAWEALVENHQEPVFRLAYLLLGDADDARDVTQETFIRAHQAIDRYDASRPLRPWLLRIAANLAYNHQRSARRYLAALQHLLRAQPPALTARQQAEQNLETGLLWEAIRRLNHADQRIIYLRYFLECSEAETAAALQVATGTVKSRLHRALGRLRVVIGKEYPQLVEDPNDEQSTARPA